MKAAPCSPECTHTQEEHEAFDAGLAAGERDPEADNPFAHVDAKYSLYTAWASGFSVGCLNRSHAMEQALRKPQPDAPDISPAWARIKALLKRKKPASNLWDHNGP